ncbi:hypothetical protein GF312_13320 [Candidatus Poribacteria bacterium]|nr:hypothetical protein [Candidatus Poribacteria bacterium]
MKRQIPLIISFVCGIFMLIQFFIPHPGFISVYRGILNWARIIGVFALIIGIGTLVRLHFRRITRRSPGWFYSVVVFAGLIVTASAGIIGGTRGKLFVWIFQNINIPLDATMFSLLAFFMASAAYRAFRARTLDATLLLIAAVIVMFGRVPIGDFLWQAVAPQSWVDKVPFLPEQVAEWVMSGPNMAARRGIMIGAALGAISTSLKIILGIERSHFASSSQ